ncbi:Heme oxygenase-like protein [Coniochaeta hoffmannii]|uniref:Heme oxygenase-like protein n=1 Tax=Coniochaeta hoffmannii TaxID=91930 RepID=A0AA38RS08_9PEZI|nr:Heme oxygenase-like protein [Coniochaeta hoffmannii]
MDSNHIPSADGPKVFLGDAINIATRSVHTRLNKLILLRLPLAIPPRADGPSAYTQGILHIAPLYISFESLWHAALHAHESNNNPSVSPRPSSPHPFPFQSGSDNPPPGPHPSRRIYTILNQLFIPGLLRSSRLRSDLRALTGWSDAALQSHLEEAASTGRLGEVVSHIRRSAVKRPHVLLAYAWVLYMALFSGGRFIRATLECAGRADGFWTDGQRRAEAVPVHGPLDFFHFPTPQDGEDLKHEFKQRLADVGGLLTEDEREDIVREAVCIFENLILVINQLDDVCHTKMEDLNSVDASVLSPRSAGFRIRDSVIVTRERSYRAQQRSQPEPEPEEEEVGGGSKETSASASMTSESESGSDEPRAEAPVQNAPKLNRHLSSCHTVQLASASPRFEKEDPFSSRRMGQARSESSSMDPELAERLARAMRFDPKLPLPERTTSATEEEEEEAQNDGGVDRTDAPEPRKRSDLTMARGIQAASALGLAVAVAVAWSRR